MNQKLNCILLVDDNEHDNLFHQLVIKKADCAEKVMAIQSAEEALDYLQTEIEKGYPCPDLIFLDINMPGMNGWEFLEKYKELKPDQKSDKVIVMLTTSLNPDDEERAKGIKEVDAFHNKPLTAHIIRQVIEKHFQ